MLINIKSISRFKSITLHFRYVYNSQLNWTSQYMSLLIKYLFNFIGLKLCVNSNFLQSNVSHSNVWNVFIRITYNNIWFSVDPISCFFSDIHKMCHIVSFSHLFTLSLPLDFLILPFSLHFSQFPHPIHLFTASQFHFLLNENFETKAKEMTQLFAELFFFLLLKLFNNFPSAWTIKHEKAICYEFWKIKSK